MRLSFLAAFAALLTLTASPVAAQSPANEQIPYQGRLTDSSGDPIADGTQTIEFTLTDAASQSWSETASVQTAGGVFTHYLGSVSAISGLDFSTAVTLSLTVDPGGAATAFGPIPLGAVPAAYHAMDGGGTLTFPLGATADTPIGGVISVFNFGTGEGLRVGGGGDGIVIDRVGDGDDDGVQENANAAGIRIFRTAGDGIRMLAVGELGDDESPENIDADAFSVGAVGGDAFSVGTVGGRGLTIDRVGTSGVGPTPHGIYIGVVGDQDGDDIPDSFSASGVRIGDVANSGFSVGETLYGDGFEVGRAASNGLYVGNSDTGVRVAAAGRYAVHASGRDGSRLLTSEDDRTYSPDLVLGGTSGSLFGDNGVLSSDPTYSSSDLMIRSYDGVFIQLDDDNDESGEFEIYNSAGVSVFGVDESGNVSLTGATQTGETSVYLDDPTAPDSRTLTLPAALSNERLVAFSGNATTDASGMAIVTLPAYTDGLAEDFRYQLTAIGSFAQAIVGDKVNGGQFTIRTSEGGVEVSWRVEGVRRDAWAQTHAHEAVAAKDQPGRYVHPEAFGLGAEAAIQPEADRESQITAEGRARLAEEAEDARRREARAAQFEQDRQDRAAERESRARTSGDIR